MLYQAKTIQCMVEIYLEKTGLFTGSLIPKRLNSKSVSQTKVQIILVGIQIV